FEPRFVPLDNISICESWRWFTSYFTSFSSFRVLRRSMDYLNRIEGRFTPPQNGGGYGFFTLWQGSHSLTVYSIYLETPDHAYCK
ncbi:hypothetical protein, partial [Dictyobacter arantiisoli]|uniref:hypothetical protein n=1 Tax=Dictyobacter arantiisoli TaxID=2014874 RepID=UPI001C0F3936